MYEGGIWRIVSAILGVVILVCLILLIVFGFKLANFNKSKAKEIDLKLTTQEETLNKEFQANQEKDLAKYVADEVFGAFEFSYPKVWSTNVTKADGGTDLLVFLADPQLIVSQLSDPPQTALRVMVLGDNYANRVKDYQTGYEVKYTERDVTVSNFKGKRFSGTNPDTKKQITFVLLPYRDKTLYIGTDNSQLYSANFEKILQTFVLNK